MKESADLISRVVLNKSRFKIADALSKRPMSVNEISRTAHLEQTNVSHNLKYLMKYKLVQRKIDGKKHIYSLRKEARVPLIKIINAIKDNTMILKKNIMFLLFTALVFQTIFVGNVSTVNSNVNLWRDRGIFNLALRMPKPLFVSNVREFLLKILKSNSLRSVKALFSGPIQRSGGMEVATQGYLASSISSFLTVSRFACAANSTAFFAIE